MLKQIPLCSFKMEWFSSTKFFKTVCTGFKRELVIGDVAFLWVPFVSFLIVLILMDHWPNMWHHVQMFTEKDNTGIFGVRKQLFSSSTHFKNAVKIGTTLPLLISADELKSRFVPCLIMHLSPLGNAVQQCAKGYCKQLTGAYHALLKNVLQNKKKWSCILIWKVAWLNI